jgi:RNA polymerase sigma-70 factor (ECF subfamily)
VSSPPATPEPSTTVDRARWFAEEVRPHETSLRSYLRYSLTSLADVDDLVQECYFRLLRARASGRIRSTRAFLFAVARNAVRDLLRRRAVADAIPIGENGESCVLEDKANILEFISQREELALLEEAICALPERCRQVFLLRKIEDMPQKEISARLGISEKTVEALVAKGVCRCADYMRERGAGANSDHAR